ncbi:MAG: NADH-quinone oxidoreductase subunit NuoE [Alphaproteobacteria bacterium]|nr:NADH-quinone oxidoreductase subunit NuoE [Alphaproteobacteria bacterium]
MSQSHTHTHPHAPFSFTPANRKLAEEIIARYPQGREASAVLPLLDLAQRQCGNWLPQTAIEHVAEVLDLAPIRVLEVASFYTMFNRKPVGRAFVQLCRTTPCWLRGSEELVATYKRITDCGPRATTPDGVFTLLEVECLGACSNAPVVQINDDFYEDLTAESFAEVLEAFKRGEKPKAGSQIGRVSSEPLGRDGE